MKRKIGKRALLLAVLAIGILIGGGLFYLYRMQHSLWDQSVDNVLEVTVQGAKSFEVYTSQGISMLEGRANIFAQYSSSDHDTIKLKLDLYEEGDPTFTAIDLTNGIMYFNSEVEPVQLPDEQVKEFLTLPESGLLKPYLSEFTGQRMVGYYERFTFSDGADGMVRKSVLLSDVSKQFALSFYDGAGFSNVVDENGDIMLRSGTESGNRTFQNIFDVVALDGNSEEDVNAFKNGMSGGKRGVIRLKYGGADHVFAFVPIDGTDGWYLISMIPSSVIMEHADSMMMSTQIMIGGIAVAMLIFAAFIIITVQHRQQVRAKDTEVQYREQMFDILANNTNDVFLIVSDDRLSVAYVSPNVERVLGISAADVVNDFTKLQRIIHGENHTDEVSSSLNVPLGSSGSYEGRYTHRNTGETRYYIETVYHTLIEDSERYIVVLADRSEERQKEATLIEALQIAKVANKAKSTFLTNMSHDIRTPMNTIVGLTTLLQRDADNSEKVREHTEKLTSSSQHLLGLINNVLDMSKIENGKTSLNMEDFSLAKLVQELDSIIRLQTKAKNQSFDITVQNILNEDLIGDRQRISQVMMNILSNAVKYTPEGGKISLNVQQLGQITQDIVRIRFMVADNGIGMSEEYQERLFQPFTREISTTVNQVQGTGLGMAITKNLVDLMGGTISVDSEQGKGSTFTIDLDLQVKRHEDDVNFWKEHHISSVLIVDDEVDICTDILGAMSGTGVAMQFALDGQTAVRMTELANQNARDFDLILLDWKMPGMDGLETAKRIRAAVPAHIPIMILTAYDYEEIRDEGVAIGIDGFLSKPFFLSNFKEVICSLNAQERSEQAEQEAASIKGRRLLCAEDNDFNAEILSELLDMEGAKADIACDGKVALDMFAAAPEGTYDAILMDVQMPVMNGYESTRAIRALDLPQAKSIPIVALTANAFADDVRDALESGMDAHLAKPVDMKKLVEVLSQIWKDKAQ